MISRFKKNIISLCEVMNIEEVIDYMIDKKAINDEFIRIISESNELTKLSNIRENKTKNFKFKNYRLDLSKIDNNYQIGYDKKRKKITVDISDNSIFSYYDDEDELKQKLENYIDNEEYEKAQILYNIINKK
jgi:hypothetical protein